MALANYLRRRGAAYSVRVPVPKDLWEVIGKREIVKALGKVRDPTEAKRKGPAAAKEIHDWFDQLRGSLLLRAATRYGAAVHQAEIAMPATHAAVNGKRQGAVEDEWSLEEACDKFITAHAKGAWTAKTEEQRRTTLDMFKRWAAPGITLSEIDRRVVGDFKALLEKLPTMYGKRVGDKDRSLQSIVEEAERAGAERLASTTIQRHLSSLTGLFRYAKEHGRYHADNPAAGFRFPRTRRPRDERPAWTPKQLEALFRSPIWTEPAPARDHRYWLPLLGAYAGLRLEEGCQLHVDDIRTEDGIAFLDIKPGDGKQLKSRAAKRRVPIHPVVIAAGFLHHVEDAQRNGSVLVFAELAGRRGGPDKRLGAAVTKAFTAYRRAIGQYEPGRDFHALRHSFTTALEEAAVPRQFIDELTGHEGTGETSRYAKGASLKVLNEAVARLDYGFDTAHLGRADDRSAVLRSGFTTSTQDP
jgi:integrase